jgi:malonate-semialdehyde dehydrogenase (acetylating)/methylmalonate-semialdehyde dehydrogenase
LRSPKAARPRYTEIDTLPIEKIPEELIDQLLATVKDPSDLNGAGGTNTRTISSSSSFEPLPKTNRSGAMSQNDDNAPRRWNAPPSGCNIPASAFGCAGQRCMAASVLVGVGDVDKYVDGLVANAKEVWTLGDKMGSVIDDAAIERVTRYIEQAEAMGAKVLLDGRGAKGPGGGSWFGPTILDHVTPEMPASCEEIFGPVLSIIRTNTRDEAIAIENANPYGNAAAIFTSHGATARYAVERFSAGMVGVNIGVPVPREPFSFGGWNDSKFGHGDITGEDGFRFWTRPRKVTTKWAAQTDQTWMG